MTLAAASTETPVSLDANVIWFQRLEGAVMLGASVAAYTWLGQSWLVFGVLLLAPDLAMLGYLRSFRAGTLSYNLVHNYVGPALLAMLGLLVGPWAFGLAAIWVAHIGMDRMIGYGLKLSTGLGDTHLGRKGKAR
ncbi:MAG: hypothetical protein JWR51_3093 [Devosia sp.]|uniref:DUF4260 domain-containing protein n=1 Tax=Devosia sp. TaxID=1871048 RepID=UPI00260CE246|nr:DUF4260 domain-containing protein [Devosia sp.]MDB5529990.1 hypothetical protein [Devosia sp.]